MALPVLPIWTIKPNWREGITERLEWLTDVLDSNNGTEQRRALRLSPRRAFEMVFNPVDAERSYFGLFLHRLASQDFMLPLYHDKARLAADVAAAATVLPIDNTYREFVTGGYAIILKDAFSYEVVEIEDQDDTSLTISALVGNWPAGSTVHPLRIARLSEESSTSAMTSRVGRATIEFELNQANDFDEGEWLETYNGIPIITRAPNRREALDLRFLRKTDTLDNDTGLTHLVDEADRAFTIQMHSWLIRGRQEHAEFRSLLYRLRGRQQAAWLPTFNNDFTLARSTAMVDTAINVKEIGYAYTGGVVSGRDHVFIRAPGGVLVGRQITGLGAPLAAGEERLNLSAPVGAVLAAGLSGSFLEIGRLDQDRIEIFHATDTSGTSECKTAFRSFLNERIEDEITSAPMPPANMNSSPCGEPLVEFNGLSWILPCTGSTGGNSCSTYSSVSSSYEVGGNPATVYDVDFRVRGEVERVTYSGGTPYGSTGSVVKDATGHSPSAYNVYSLQVSDPPATYYLNNGSSSSSANSVLDYMLNIPIRGGATITLVALTIDNVIIKNNTNVIVPDDDPAYPIVVAQPFIGQFLQIDGALSL